MTKQTITRWLLTLALAVAATTVTAQPIGLKGFNVGAQMTSCPDGKPPQPHKAAPNQTVCWIPVTSFAGQPVDMFFVAIYEGKIYSVSANIKGGSEAARAVHDALVEVYGKPSQFKPHIDEFSWFRGSHGISVSGNRFTKETFVQAMDFDAYERLKGQQAKKNKGDI